MEKLKVYSQEEATRLYQFKRARGLLDVLNQQEDMLIKGGRVMATDKTINEIHFFDYQEFGMLRGALGGIFDECLDLGLKDEIINK